MRIERGLQEPVLRVGNLDAIRDLGDVRDTVDAYQRLIETSRLNGVVNVATGHGVQVRAVLKMLLDMSAEPIRIEDDPARMRPSDIPSLVGDAGLLSSVTGWMPSRPLEQTLGDVLTFHRGSCADG